MKTISPDEVRHIAALARLLLTPEEVTRFATQLTSILDYVTKLNELDTESVEPTRQVTDVVNASRPDAVLVQKPETVKAILDAAPETTDGGIRVPPVFSR